MGKFITDRGFSFIDRASETSEAASTGTRTQAGEIEYWKSISDSDSAILYKAYLEEFPNGLFRTIALQRLASVTEPTIEPTVEPIIEPAVEPAIDDDLTVFQSIQNSSDASDFEAYLQQFPDGKFAPLAKARIEAIKLSQQQANVNTTTTVPITRTVPKSEFVEQLMGANDTIGLMKEIERQIDAGTAWVAQGIWNSLSTGWKAAARFENGDILLKFSKQGRITKCREKFELGTKLDFYCHFRGRQLWIRGVFPWIKFPKGRAEYLFTNRVLESFLAENGITIVD